MRWLAPYLLCAPMLWAAETEVLLEEGNVEIQLKNGVFVALSAGADVRIVHDDDGFPEMVEIRAGAAQIISSFGDAGDMAVRVGSEAFSIGRGAAIFSLRPEGGVEAIQMSGDGFAMGGREIGNLGAGARISTDRDGAIRQDKLPPGDMLRRSRAFGKPPPKPDGRPRDDGERVGGPSIRPGALKPGAPRPKNDGKAPRPPAPTAPDQKERNKPPKAGAAKPAGDPGGPKPPKPADPKPPKPTNPQPPKPADPKPPKPADPKPPAPAEPKPPQPAIPNPPPTADPNPPSQGGVSTPAPRLTGEEAGLDPKPPKPKARKLKGPKPKGPNPKGPKPKNPDPPGTQEMSDKAKKIVGDKKGKK